MLEHVEQGDRIERPGRDPGIFERHGTQVQATPAAELDRRGVEIDAHRLPAGVTRRFDDKSGTAPDVEIAWPFPRQMRRHQLDALPSEALDAIIVAVDPQL